MFIDFTNTDFENGRNINKLNWTVHPQKYSISYGYADGFYLTMQDARCVVTWKLFQMSFA